MSQTNTVIYHNPNCGTSRNTLAMIRQSGNQLIDLMLVHPILINRPIVVTPKGVKLCRPSEAVLDILPNPHIGRFLKEDGEAIDAA